jgi:hypothetical protein
VSLVVELAVAARSRVNGDFVMHVGPVNVLLQVVYRQVAGSMACTAVVIVVCKKVAADREVGDEGWRYRESSIWKRRPAMVQ